MKWYQKPWVTVLLLFLFFPVGLYLMWRYQAWNRPVKIIISVVCTLVFLLIASISNEEQNIAPVPSSSTSSEMLQSSGPEQQQEEQPNATAPNSSAQSAQSQETEPNVTMGQKNALNSAKNYLSIMAFSYRGLIDQLDYDGYSTEEATYAVENCGADWNEQAAKKAKDYLDIMSFSRSGLIDQLKFDGFTAAQAEYGVKAAGY